MAYLHHEFHTLMDIEVVRSIIIYTCSLQEIGLTDLVDFE